MNDKKEKISKNHFLYTFRIFISKCGHFPCITLVGQLKKKKKARNCANVFHIDSTYVSPISKSFQLVTWRLEKTSKYRTKRGRQIQLPGQFVDKRIISVAVKIAFRFGLVTGIDNSVVEDFQQMLSVLCVIENQVNEKFENRQWHGKCYFNS